MVIRNIPAFLRRNIRCALVDKFFDPSQKGRMGNVKGNCSSASRKFSFLPFLIYVFKRSRALHGFSPKMDASFFRCRDPLCLSLEDEFAFSLCHVAQELQNDVCD